MKVGDKVKVKSWEEILKTLNKGYNCLESCKDGEATYFKESMFQYVNLIGTISKIDKGTGNIEIKSKDWSCPWWWHPSWLELIPEESDYLNDGSIEQRSLCLALIRQAMSGNEPNLNIFTPNEPCNAKDAGGFYYADFPEDSWFRTIAKNFPNWPCLKLKPEILEEAIKNCLSQHDLPYFKECVKENINRWFVFNYTEKPDFWYKVVYTLGTIPLETVKNTNIEQPIKEQKNEIKFQRRKSTVLRGTVPEGSQQSSGKCKATTCSGHLSYQVCSGR